MVAISGRGQIIAKLTVLVLVLLGLMLYLQQVMMPGSLRVITEHFSQSNNGSSSLDDADLSKTDEGASVKEDKKTPSAVTAITLDSTKVAFLVETRPLPHLPALFAHMTSVIPPEWTFRFMGSAEAIDFMRSSPLILRLEASGKLKIIPLPAKYSMRNRESISQMFTDVDLYRNILAPAEHLLVFQPDSIICANSEKSLNDFLDWDWIGAPWSAHATRGGNGGLCLRKVSKVLKVLDHSRRPVNSPQLEDLWLSNHIADLPGSTIPSADISKTFSVESVWDDRPLGYHIGWLGVHHGQIWDKEDQVHHVIEYCPEVKMIVGMKLSNDKPVGVPRL